MTVESAIRNILEGKRLRKESSSIGLKEAIAMPTAARTQSKSSADDMSTNQRPPLNTNTAAGDSTRTAPTPTPGAKAADSSSTNQNPQSSQNQAEQEPTEYVDPNAGTMKERKPGESESAYQFRMKSQQFELEKYQKYDEWKTKQDAWQKQHGRAYNQQEYDKKWEQGVRDVTLRQQSGDIEAGRQAAKQADSYVSAETAQDFEAVEASRKRAAAAKGDTPASKYEGPTRLSPEEMAAKLKSQGIDKSPQQIQAERDELDKMRVEFDKTRPEGQPASFTPEGKPPEQGKRADGTAVGPYTAPKTGVDAPGTGISPEEELSRQKMGSQIGYGRNDVAPTSVSNISGGGVASAGINEFQPIERKQFNFTNRMREGFVAFSSRNERKRMISEAVNNIFGK